MLNYEVRGDGEAVVLVHGLFGSLNNLKTLSNHLSKGFKVVNVDLPNHGTSLHLGKTTIESMAEALNDLVSDLGLERFSLVGHSLGGKVSMKFSQCYPKKITKLIVADIAPVDYPDRHHAVFSALNSINLETVASKGEAQTLLNESGLDPKVSLFIVQSLIEHDGQFKWKFDLRGLENSYSDLMAWKQTDEKYCGPSLFIKAQLSDYICDDHEKTIKHIFPMASIQVMEGVGHWLHVEKVKTFNRVVKDFLIKNEPLAV